MIEVAVLALSALCAQARAEAALPAPPVVPVGVRFAELGIDDAIAVAQQQHRAVVALIAADWCPGCQQLKREMLDTAAAGFLSDRALAVRLDFDAAATAPLIRRFNIISLPTLLVLRPDGSEIGRVEGYQDKKSFAADAAVLLDGRDTLVECQARLDENRADVKALFCVGKALIDRGRVDEGLPMLEEVLVRDPQNSARVSDQALFVMGRYFARVRDQPRAARHYFRELDARFPRTEYGRGAAWWYARSLLKIGMAEHGYLYLEQRARRLGTAEAIEELGNYALAAKVHQQEALREVHKAARRFPRNSVLKKLAEDLGRDAIQTGPR
ncbi:MAG: thioredoxin family protein [Deltaproteobacteria bacterium]|nr:thioredoxin family protein [Deltaproteobacteria bacterium]